jgi:thioredoxin-related protein
MKLTHINCAALVALHCSVSAFAAGEGWTTDYAAAKKDAAENKKDLLIDFTGSDWCGWCIKLNEEVFQHDPFKTGVKDDFVLVELDFPRDKSKQSDEVKAQNEELNKKYAVQGFPTILLADAEGRPYAKTGYQAGGPEKYVAHLDELRAKKTARDEAFATAEKSTGVDKAKALVAALKAMDLEDAMVSNFYGEVVASIKEADPKDETGFVADLAMKEKMEKFQAELNSFGQKQDHEGALAVVENALKEGGFTKEDTQRIALTKAMIFAQTGKIDEALEAVDAAKELAPESELAGRMDGMKAQLNQMKAQKEAE